MGGDSEVLKPVKELKDDAKKVAKATKKKSGK